MKFVNPDESWSSRTGISGYDPKKTPDGTSHLGVGLAHLHFLLGTTGAQTKRVHVRIGSQLFGTAQIKRAEILHGSHILLGNEVIYTDPLDKGIHGDENDVSLLLTTHFATTVTCTSDVTCAILFLFVQQARHFV